MDLLNEISSAVELANNVSTLLQKQSDRLLHQRDTLFNNPSTDLDISQLGKDVELASRCLNVLEARRELRAAIKDLVEIQEKGLKWQRVTDDVEDEEEPEMTPDEWADYAQDALDRLQATLRNTLAVANDEESGKPTLLTAQLRSHQSALESSQKETVSRRRHTMLEPSTLNYANYMEQSKAPSIGTSFGSIPMPGEWGLAHNSVSTPIPQESYSTPSTPSQSLTTSSPGGIDQDQDQEEQEAFVDAKEEVDFEPGTEPKDSGSNFYMQGEGTSSSTETITNKRGPKKSNGPGAEEMVRITSDGGRPRMGRRGSSLSVYSLPAGFDDMDDELFFDRRSLAGDYPDNISEYSYDSLPTTNRGFRTGGGGALTVSLENHGDRSNLFAQGVTVSNPLRIGVGYGSYIVYTVTVKGSSGANIIFRKRYSDFVALRAALLKQQPNFKNGLPKLPPKKVVGKFTPTFLEKRRRELEYFLHYVLLHPTLGASSVCRRWVSG